MLTDFQFLQTFFEMLPDIPSPFSADADDSIMKMIKETAEKSLEQGEKIVQEKSKQLGTLVGVIAIPIVLAIGALIIKVAYNIFTGTADKVDKGVRIAAAKAKEATDKLKKTIIEKALNDDGEKEKKEAKPKKKKRRMLLGEILTQFVIPTLTLEELEEALEAQKNSDPKKKLGDILIETDKISKHEVTQALKIQEKQAG